MTELDAALSAVTQERDALLEDMNALAAKAGYKRKDILARFYEANRLAASAKQYARDLQAENIRLHEALATSEKQEAQLKSLLARAVNAVSWAWELDMNACRRGNSEEWHAHKDAARAIVAEYADHKEKY